jgi:hypothetical protein
MGFLRKKAKSPNYTVRQFVFKGIQILLYAVAFDLAGAKIYELEVQYALNQITHYEAFGPQTIYYYLVCGLCIGLAFWKLLEVYWFGKDRLEENRIVV